MDYRPLKFINEPIAVQHAEAPMLEKRPGVPQSFTWRKQVFPILEVLLEWHDYQRRGRMARNMQPQHAESASKRGSWGVGQDYYRVRTEDGRIFDIYYDRSPQDVDRRKGGWFLDREVEAL